MGARYYNAIESRFTQVDPSGQDFYYNFAGDDPIDFSDPSGYYSAGQCISDLAGVAVGSISVAGDIATTIASRGQAVKVAAGLFGQGVLIGIGATSIANGSCGSATQGLTFFA